MTNRANPDANFGGAWCNRMTTKQQGCHSITPADKQVNEPRYTQPPPNKLIKIHATTSAYRNKKFNKIKVYNTNAEFDIPFLQQYARFNNYPLINLLCDICIHKVQDRIPFVSKL